LEYFIYYYSDSDFCAITDEIDEVYKREVVNWNSGRKRNWNLNQCNKNLNSWNPSDSYIDEKNKSRITELDLINLKNFGNVLTYQFREVVEKSLTVHDIRRWSLKAQDDVCLSSNYLFTAFIYDVYKMDSWIQANHRIVSRKINKFVTQETLTDKAKLKEQTFKFVQDIKKKLWIVGENNV